MSNYRKPRKNKNFPRHKKENNIVYNYKKGLGLGLGITSGVILILLVSNIIITLAKALLILFSTLF